MSEYEQVPVAELGVPPEQWTTVDGAPKPTFDSRHAFVSIPVDPIVEHIGGGREVIRKVFGMARATLDTPEVALVQTLVECFVEPGLGKHPEDECIRPDSAHLRHYVFQAARS